MLQTLSLETVSVVVNARCAADGLCGDYSCSRKGAHAIQWRRARGPLPRQLAGAGSNKARSSGLNRPPASMPKTTNRQRPCPPARSSGYVRCLRALAWRCAQPGSASAPGRGSPHLCSGLTSVVSTEGRPLATTSMRRPSVAGTSAVRSRRATLAAALLRPLCTCALLPAREGPVCEDPDELCGDPRGYRGPGRRDNAWARRGVAIAGVGAA